MNTQYNWQYIQNNGAVPPVISGAKLTLSDMSNGQYAISFYSCSTGEIISTTSASVTNNSLSVALPAIAWDIAFTATNQTVLAINISKFYGEQKDNQNILHINIAQSENVKSVMLERTNDGVHFKTLSNLSASWTTINGTHVYADAAPLKGNNFYRLNTIDNDGKQTLSNIVLLVNNKVVNISLYPNPFKDYVMLKADAGKYQVNITNEKGTSIYNNTINAGSGDTKITLPQIARGIYYVTVKNESGVIIETQKLFKE